MHTDGHKSHKSLEGVRIDPPSSFQLPCLKKLDLYQVFYESDPFVRLLSGCPVLEDLSFDRDFSDSVSIYKICVPTLKRLTMVLLILHNSKICFRLDFKSTGSLLGWKKSTIDPLFLSSHLTNFYLREVKGLEHEMEFVKYILKEAGVLKSAKIRVGNIKLKEIVREKLSKIPRRSMTCLLTMWFCVEYKTIQFKVVKSVDVKLHKAQSPSQTNSSQLLVLTSCQIDNFTMPHQFSALQNLMKAKQLYNKNKRVKLELLMLHSLHVTLNHHKLINHFFPADI
ncbi:fbd-associated f-box protein [Quercus suber]|uniref:Fbd-associated f-box protein n=1 Tax=Quercus suber TaxID=58331 RepID=A0AAW0KA75_QUESU